MIAATSLADLRGVVRRVCVLTFPLALAVGFPFSTRDLARFLTAGVITAFGSDRG
jgi:CPA1 family monovalent cation:H+ antiporter